LQGVTPSWVLGALHRDDESNSRRDLETEGGKKLKPDLQAIEFTGGFYFQLSRLIR
jgi:hypothetical protein